MTLLSWRAAQVPPPSTPSNYFALNTVAKPSTKREHFEHLAIKSIFKENSLYFGCRKLGNLIALRKMVTL